MVSTADSLRDLIIANYGSLGGGGATPAHITNLIDSKTTPPFRPVEESIIIWLPVVVTRIAENMSYAHLRYELQIRVATPESDDRLKTITDEVRRVVSTYAISYINVQKIGNEEDVSDRRAPQYKKQLKVTLEQNMFPSKIAWSASSLDENAIHVNESAEINTIAEKGTPVDADILVIEDSAASWVKKKVQLSNLPGGGGGPGTGTQWKLPVWDTTTTLGDSMISQNSGGTIATINGKTELTPSETATYSAIKIIPSAAISSSSSQFAGVEVVGSALDPSAGLVALYGTYINFSGVNLSNNPHVQGIRVINPGTYAGGDEAAGFFSGDGKTVWVCHDDYGIWVDTGDVKIDEDLIVSEVYLGADKTSPKLANNTDSLELYSGSTPTLAVTIGTSQNVTLAAIAAGVSDYNKFLVSDTGEIKFRTGAEAYADMDGYTSSDFTTAFASESFSNLGTRTHALAGADHTASGLTVGWVIAADSATTFSWQAPAAGGGTVSGTGTAGKIAKWATGGADIEDSTISCDGTDVTVAGDLTILGEDIKSTGGAYIGLGSCVNMSKDLRLGTDIMKDARDNVAITTSGTGDVTVSGSISATIAAEATDVDKFLVSNTGLVKFRTGAEAYSDMDGYVTADFTTDFAAESLANLTTRAHANLSDAPTDAHHNEAHVLATTGPHTGTLPVADITNGTDGYYLKGGATIPVYEQRKFTIGGTIMAPEDATVVIAFRAPFACTATEVNARQSGGTSTVIQALNNGTDIMSADLTLTTTATWYSSAANQNTSFAEDAMLQLEVTTAGTADQVFIQVTFTED